MKKFFGAFVLFFVCVVSNVKALPPIGTTPSHPNECIQWYMEVEDHIVNTLECELSALEDELEWSSEYTYGFLWDQAVAEYGEHQDWNHPDVQAANDAFMQSARRHEEIELVLIPAYNDAIDLWDEYLIALDVWLQLNGGYYGY